MASRDLVYRVTLETSQAQRAARQIRQTIEAELRTIQVGQLNISSLTSATNEAQRFRHELEQAAQVASGIQVNPNAVPAKASSGIGTGVRSGGDLSGLLGQIPVIGQLGSALAGGFAAGAVVAGIKEIGGALDELGRRGAVFGQISDVLGDYAAAAGTTSKAIVDAGKAAAQGTISEFDLILNANRALQFQVAKTPEAFGKLIELSTALGRAQGITDTDALDYIVRGIARQSSLILDNLGLFIDLEKVQSDYAQSLGKTSSQLTAAEKNQAVLNEAFRQGETAIQANRDAANSAATQYERFDAGIQNLKDRFGEWLAEASASKIKAVADAVNEVNEALNGEGDLPQWMVDFGKMIEEQGKGFSQTNPQLTAAGIALEYYGLLIQGLDKSTRASMGGMYDHANAIMGVGAAANDAAAKVNALKEAERQERADKLARVAGFSDQQENVNKSLDTTAQKSVGDLGLENTIAILKQQKAIVDAAIKDLITSSITDPSEIALRIAEIQQAAQQAFTDAVAEMPEVDPSVTAGSFEVINQSMMAMNQGFVDFLPSVSAVREELISLAEEVMFTGVVTAEQAAALEGYASVAASIADETSMLAAVTDELGVSFLYANPEAAGLVDAMYQAQASFLAGNITAEAYAGMLSSLGQQLLILAQQAGVATGSILTLVQAQAGLAGKGQFSIGAARGNAVGARISAQQDERNRQRAIQEAERAAKRAAQESERSAKRAGKELESAAKKAAQELKSALDKVPGLFSRSQVTEGDMKLSKAGVYLDKADEKLRRLQAEVEQGKDLFGDISIGEAKQSLIDLGVQVAEDEKVAFQQFADAWESGLLFFDPANIEKYINEEAVQRDLDLQKKAAEGKDNIYKAFGVAIDDAVDAAVGGISGGGGGASGGVADLQIPITATLEPIPPITETPTVPVQPYISPTAWKQIEMPPLSMPIQSQVTGTQANAGATTGLFDVTAIQAQLDTLKFPQFDATAMGLADLQAQIDGLTTKVEITATLSPDAGTTIASDLADQLATQVATFKSQGGTIGDILLAGIGESFNVIQGDKVVDTGVADSIIASIGAQLGAKVKTLEGVGAGVGQIVKAGIANDMGTVQWADGEIVAPIANGLITAISTQVRGTTEGFKREGASIAQLVMAGLSSGLSGVSAEGTQSADLAFVLAGAINSQFSTNANFFYAAGQPVATDVMSGYKSMFSGNTEGAPLVTPMITAINTQIRMQGESLQNQGITMAQYVQNGFTTAFNGEAFKGAIIAAGETMGAYLEIGILSRIRGGALVEAIGAQVLADITAEVEAP